MPRYIFAVLLPVLICTFNGCSDGSGVVATDEEIAAHVEQYGDLSTDPEEAMKGSEIED